MSNRSATLPGPSRHTPRPSHRPPGREWVALAWVARHPLFLAHPAVVLASLVALGAPATVTIYLGVAALVVIWWRSHPPSFDRWAAPRIRSAWRRWTDYRGRRWTGLVADCGLTREHRHTGQTLVPRVLRVRSTTPSIDVLTVRMVRGQDVRIWQDTAGLLAEALIVERVAVTRARPGVVRVVVEREMPFRRVIPAIEIPAESADVDLSALEIGENEFGDPVTVNIERGHGLFVGASGAGKSSIMWGTQRAAGPCIRDGLVRVWMIDLKGGVETEQGAPLFHRWATDLTGAVELLTDYRDAMLETQAWMRDNKIRACTPSADTPVNLLQFDEMAMATAYGDRSQVRQVLALLSEIMTQGRASLFSVQGYLQEPTKDVVDVRDLFGHRLCLGVNAASHVDMSLGEGARDRGALADEIPGDEDHAGIGFGVDKTSRLPYRFRAAHVRDEDIAELVARCTPHDAEVIALPLRDNDTDASDQGDDEDEEVSS